MVSVTHEASPCVADHSVRSAPVPVIVTAAESVTAVVLPSMTDTRRLDGSTVIANGAGSTSSVSITCAGLPDTPAALTVTVST